MCYCCRLNVLKKAKTRRNANQAIALIKLLQDSLVSAHILPNTWTYRKTLDLQSFNKWTLKLLNVLESKLGIATRICRISTYTIVFITGIWKLLMIET